MKRSLFLKISALFLALLLCTPLLLSCNDTTYLPSGGQEQSPTEDPEKPTETPAVSNPVVIIPDQTSSKPTITERFDGRKINFYVNDNYSDARSIDIGENDDPKHEANVHVMKRNAQVEQELGVDIVLAQVGSLVDTFSVLQPLLASEMYIYDVIMLNQYFDIGLATGDTLGSFYNLRDLPEGVTSYLNLEASYWDQTMFEALNYKGVGFFLTGDLALSHNGGMYVSYVNADMWAKYADSIKTLEHSGGYSDIYDIVYNGYWTIDLWMELAKLCYEDDGDTVKDYEDQCGFMTYDQQLNNLMVDALMAGSNIYLGGKYADGTPNVEIHTDKNIAFYNKLYTLLCESNTVNIPWLGGIDGEDGSYILDIFAKGKVLLNVNTLAQAEEHLLDMEDAYLIMPLPLFDRDQFDSDAPSKGYATRYGDSLSQLAICRAIGDEKLPAVTATLELMAYYSEKWVTPAYHKAILGERCTTNNTQMIAMIEQGAYTDFVYVWAHSLGDATWIFRQHYSEGTKIENNLRQWDRNTTGLLNNKLLEQIEDCICRLK